MKLTRDFQSRYFGYKGARTLFIDLKSQSSRNITAIAASIFIVIFYLIQLKYSWPGLQNSRLRGPSNYIDQASVLNSAKCFKDIGLEVYKLDASPSGCGGFVYSIELLRFLNFFHLSNLSSEVLGATYMWLTLVALCSIFLIVKNFGKFDILVAVFAFVSPGIWLLLERGNYDELVFIFVLIASYLLSTKYQELGMILLATTALMKFYTLPAFLIAILFLKRRNAKILFGLIAIPMSFYLAYLIKLVADFPSTWFISFGLDSLGLYSNLFIREEISQNSPLPSTVVTLIGFSIIALMIFFFTKIKITSKIELTTDLPNNRGSIIYITLLTVFLACFFAGMNYDYRLIYLAALVALTPSILAPSPFKRFVTTSGCIALSFSTYSFGLSGVPALIFQLFGDVVLYIFVSLQLLYLCEVFFRTILGRFLQLLGANGPKSMRRHA